MVLDPDTRPDATTLAFRLGQLDTVARCLLGNATLYTPVMREALALRWLGRIWAQYREDRAISGGEALCGAECAAVRNAFLSLLEDGLMPEDTLLPGAIRTVRRIAIRPLAQERQETEDITARSAPVLTAVLDALTSRRLPRDPVQRLCSLVTQFRYSHTADADPGAATAQTPCWALNLVAAARSPALHLARTPLPVPHVVQRKMFRADRDSAVRRDAIAATLDRALHDTMCDIALIQRADQAFKRECPKQRAHSRLHAAWMLLFALEAITPSQLARALPATKAGAAKLLRQLVAAQLARHHGGHTPYVCAIRFPIAFPAWGVDSFDAPPLSHTAPDPHGFRTEIED
jgi:hypothetical protein